MPKARAHELFLSKLNDYKNRLPYLTENDWALLIDRSKALSFKENEPLIYQGKPTEVMYLIASGKVNVSFGGKHLSQIGPGEICGEMSFLENSLPSATAIAAADVDAYAVNWSTLTDLFELFPHLASRFYRSLALNLSRRLRELVARQK